MRHSPRILLGSLCALVTLAALAHGQTDQKLRFVVLGHLRGDANGELLPILPDVVESVRREDADLVFLCGDLIWGDIDRDGPADAAQIRADWERFDAAISGVGAEIHRVPGNHDIADVVTRDIWRERYGVLPRTVQFRNSRFVLLNSAWWPPDGDTRKHPQDKIRGVALDAAQITFLHSELEHPSAEHVFLFMHHLLWWEDEASWWKNVAPEFENKPVRAVFSGDYGPLKFSHLERGNVHYVQTSIENRPSVEMLRSRESSRLLSAQLDNYIVVDVDGADVRYSVRSVAAMSSGKFSPEHYREIYAFDKHTYGRKLHDRWSTPGRLIIGLAQVSALAFTIGAISVFALVLLWRLRTRKRA